MARRDLGDVAVSALTRPGVGSALLAGLGVYLVLALQAVLVRLVEVATEAEPQDVGTLLALVLPTALPLPLPFAVGAFLSFWQLAPVAPQLRMAHVVTRALLAALAGAATTAVVGFLVGVGVNFASGAPDVVGNLLDTGRAVLPGALNLLIDGFVVVPLAALLLWGRLQRHPPRSAPAGALDEV